MVLGKRGTENFEIAGYMNSTRADGQTVQSGFANRNIVDWPRVVGQTSSIQRVEGAAAPKKTMKKFLAAALCFAVVLSAQPVSVVAAPAKVQKPAADAGQVGGRALVDGKPLMNVAVRLRNVDTGEIVGTTTANTAGEFSFAGLSAGNFIVETVSANGVILGTSTKITLTSGAMIAANLTVGTSAAALAAGGGVAGGFVGGLTTATAGATAGAAAAGGAAAGVVASAAGGLGALLGSTVGIVTLSAATVGVTAGVVATRTSVSGSQ